MSKFPDQYRATPLKFSSYYKYAFTFTGTASDGAEIVAVYGGYADDIYRFSVTPDKAQFIGEYEYDWQQITIRKGDDVVYDEYFA